MGANREELSDRNALGPGVVEAIERLLASAQYELIPLKTVMDAVAALPSAATVTVTASPAKGLDPTIDLSERLAALGFTVIPHLSARLTRSRSHLEQMVARLESAGISRAFVVGGDGDPTGPFPDGLSLLRALDDVGHGLTSIGIPCYPEGHPAIAEETLLEALRLKSEFASYMTTQMCFDPDAIERWIKQVRSIGVELPVHIGLPGVAPLHRLASISARIGIGDSARFLSKNTSLVGRLVRPGGYAPDELILRLGSAFVDPGIDIQGLHVYTFNQVSSTEAWRAQFVSRLTDRS